MQNMKFTKKHMKNIETDISLIRHQPSLVALDRDHDCENVSVCVSHKFCYLLSFENVENICYDSWVKRTGNAVSD